VLNWRTNDKKPKWGDDDDDDDDDDEGYAQR